MVYELADKFTWRCPKMSQTVYIRPLVPRHLYAFGETVRKLLPSAADTLLVYHPKISLLANPEKIATEIGDRELVSLAFRGSVDLVLVKNPPYARPYAAFDIHRGPAPEQSGMKTQLFQHLGIPYHCLQATLWEDCAENLIRQIMRDAQKSNRARNPISKSQWETMNRLAQVAAQHNVFLLHEVALESVIAVRDVQPDGSGKGLPLFLHRDFLSKTSFDAVIATRPPNSKPICAVEFDGPHHLEPDQIKRDQKKDQACIEAKIPLIRIPCADTDASPSRGPVVSMQKHSEIVRTRLAWEILEATVRVISATHLSSVWYLTQLHQFLLLEASHVSNFEPDGAATLRDYADELWRLAHDRIAKLEQRVVALDTALKEPSPFEEYFVQLHQESDMEQSLLTDWDLAVENFQQRLSEDFPRVIEHERFFRLVQYQYEKQPIPSRKGVNTHSVTFQGSSLLKALGVTIRKRTLATPPLGITIVGDIGGASSDILDEIPRKYLHQQVSGVIATYERRIREAVKGGGDILWDHAAAKIWPKLQPSTLKSIVNSMLEGAYSATEHDWSGVSEEDVIRVFGDLNGSLPTRSVPQAEREKRLQDAVEKIRSAFRTGEFEEHRRSEWLCWLQERCMMVAKAGRN